MILNKQNNIDDTLSIHTLHILNATFLMHNIMRKNLMLGNRKLTWCRRCQHI